MKGSWAKSQQGTLRPIRRDRAWSMIRSGYESDEVERIHNNHNEASNTMWKWFRHSLCWKQGLPFASTPKDGCLLQSLRWDLHSFYLDDATGMDGWGETRRSSSNDGTISSSNTQLLSCQVTHYDMYHQQYAELSNQRETTHDTRIDGPGKLAVQTATKE